MSVAPLPKFQSLYLANTSARIRLTTETPSIAEFGRFHFGTCDLRMLERAEKEKVRDMAFQIIDIATLPVREFGRHSTEPKITITENGQFQFNKFIQEKWGYVKDAKAEDRMVKLLVRFDPDSRTLAFNGFKASDKPKAGGKELDGKSLLPVRLSKDGTQISAAGTGILNQLKYEFSKAGSQSFEAKFDDKGKFYGMVLPAETPAMKPKQVRVKKVKAATAPNGAVATSAPVNVTPPAEEELLDLQ